MRVQEEQRNVGALKKQLADANAGAGREGQRHLRAGLLAMPPRPCLPMLQPHATCPADAHARACFRRDALPSVRLAWPKGAVPLAWAPTSWCPTPSALLCHCPTPPPPPPPSTFACCADAKRVLDQAYKLQKANMAAGRHNEVSPWSPASSAHGDASSPAPAAAARLPAAVQQV